MKDKTEKMSIYLHKETVKDFDECLKREALKKSSSHSIKKEIGLEGKIYIHEPNKKMPYWKETLERLTEEAIEVDTNSSNKAVIVFEYNNRYISIVYGYGKSMLKESTLERNFGLIVAANLIDPKKIRSLNSMTIEDTIVDMQKQTVSYSDQDSFQIDREKEILKAVSGAPSLESTAKFLVGTDSLTATRKMDIENIKESIKFYFEAFQEKKYIDNGFGWLNNIKRVKDSDIKQDLDKELEKDILTATGEVVIAPNRIIDWENIDGFCFRGIGKVKDEDYSMILDEERYLTYLRSKELKNILSKLKRDKIEVRDNNGEKYNLSSVYEGIIYEKNYDKTKYLLCYGDWYEIDEDFYNRVRNRVLSVVECEVSLPICKKGISEGTYNNELEKLSDDYVTLDQKNYSIPGYGRSRVEPCDLLTRDKKLIHIKIGGSSSTLSHLFAQGLTSARLLRTDIGMKNHINKYAESKFGPDFIKETDENSDFEIVYAIIDHRKKPFIDILPFFSLVNLAQTLDQLEAMNYNYSLMKIDRIK